MPRSKPDRRQTASPRRTRDKLDAKIRGSVAVPEHAIAPPAIPPAKREGVESRVEFVLEQRFGRLVGNASELERAAREIVSVVDEALGGCYRPPGEIDPPASVAQGHVRDDYRDALARVLQDHFLAIRSDRSMWDAAEAVLRTAEHLFRSPVENPIVRAFTNLDRHNGHPARFESADPNLRLEVRTRPAREPLSLRVMPDGWLEVSAGDQQLVVEPTAANTIRIRVREF